MATAVTYLAKLDELAGALDATIVGIDGHASYRAALLKTHGRKSGILGGGSNAAAIGRTRAPRRVDSQSAGDAQGAPPDAAGARWQDAAIEAKGLRRGISRLRKSGAEVE